MKLINIITCLFLIVIFSSCFNKKTSKNISETKVLDSLRAINISYIDVSMENDTLERKEEKGIIKFFFKIDDTLKLSSKDERRIFALFSLVPNRENKNKLGKDIEKELIFSSLNVNDTIIIPFSLTPHFSGKATISGIMADVYYLHSYNNDGKVRRVEYESLFEKEVYIK